jgi:hypothetical protein
LASGDYQAFLNMTSSVEAFSLLAYLENDSAKARFYTARAALALRTWFVSAETAMLPNLYYAQITPTAPPPPSPPQCPGGFLIYREDCLNGTVMKTISGDEGACCAACKLEKDCAGWSMPDGYNGSVCELLKQPLVNWKGAQTVPGSTCKAAEVHSNRLAPRCSFIDWRKASLLLDMVEVLRAADRFGEWSKADDEAMRAWWRGFETNVMLSPLCAFEHRESMSNHATWFDAVWQSVALFNGNSTGAIAAANELTRQSIAYQLLPSGEEWMEVKRETASLYCIFDLKALTIAADIAASNPAAPDVWAFATPDGRSIRKSIDWLVPYALGQKPWPYPTGGLSFFECEYPECPLIDMFEVLRRASVAYNSTDYELAACKMMHAAGQASGYAADPLNLMLPAKFNVSCGHSTLSGDWNTPQ